ncbi:C4-dicarboxylate ABC transporter substrate-binding protein, partial [Salmonella enterica subsp. enterica serovar Enteritidis]
ALTEGQHGEVAKVYSYTEHAIIPDVLVISQETREKLSNQDFQIIVEAARESTEELKELWEDAVTESKKTAKEEMDVTFINDINKEPFKEATEHII